MTFTMIVTSVLRPDPFIHTLIWVSWASNDAHQRVYQGHSIVAPIGKQRGLVVVININPQCHVVWEHVDMTPRSTRSQIASNSGLGETSKCLISPWMSRSGSFDFKLRILFRSQRLLSPSHE
jgi:hypothetical protein